MQTRLPSPPALGDRIKFKKNQIKDTKELAEEFEKVLNELELYTSKLVQSLERALSKLPERPFTKDRVKVTGLTKQYTLDSTAGTLADVRQVLGTLLQDLQETGALS
jgi:hypothetical protein